jgi:mono/diheme cytochrome c family protein
MSDHLPQENDYSDRDIRIRPLAIFLVATLFVTALTILGVKVLFNSYADQTDAMMQDLDVLIEANRPTNAVVEGLGEAAESLRRLHAAADARLNHYAWVDKEANLVQIPVARAMELIAAEGLPVRQAVTPSGSADETPVQAGERLFAELGCIACHGAVSGALGPSLTGVYGHDVALADGTTVKADEAYIRSSILEPLGQVVAGYAPVMPSFKGIVTDDQLDKLVAYVKSLGGN